MNEDKENIDYHELIAKYLSGNTTASEVQLLEQWVLSNAENKNQFLKLQQTWYLSKSAAKGQELNVNKEWSAISQKIGFSEKTSGKVVPMKNQKPSLRWLSIAAAVAVLVIAGFWLFNNNTNTNSLIVTSEQQTKAQQLADGTQINLNQFSTINYTDAKDGTRQVALSGDAFFEVARDEQRPFVIKAKEVAIKVLGTSFYVDARDNANEVQVIVASGTVAMEAAGKKVILEKGDIGTYLKSNQELSKKQNEDANYLAWQTKRLVYEKALLGKVVYDLNRTFHADIRLENAGLQNCLLTATYEDQTLESIIRILEKTLNLKATRNGEKIVLSGSPCE
jgi:transmembrane sensor